MIAYYTATSGINIAALLILDYIIRHSNGANKKARRFFHLSILAIMVAITAEIVTIYFGNADFSHRALHLLGNVVGFSVAPFIPLFIGCAIHERHRKSTLLFWIPAIVNSLLSLLSCLSPIIFRVSKDNLYSRGSFFWIFLVSYTTGLVYLFIETLAATRQYQNSNRYILFILFLFLIFGTSIQVIAPQLYISWICISFSMMLYYVYYCELYQQIDGLTELLNRRAYESYLGRIDGKKSVAIMILDIDDFKSINDQYGHPFGDFCITTISSCFKKSFFKTGLCFRTGGDEFCIISETADEATLQSDYHRFLRELASMHKTEIRLPLVSAGSFYYDKDTTTIHEAIFKADQRMYDLKQLQKLANSPHSQWTPT